jgi:hypothetical protein
MSAATKFGFDHSRLGMRLQPLSLGLGAEFELQCLPVEKLFVNLGVGLLSRLWHIHFAIRFQLPGRSLF